MFLLNLFKRGIKEATTGINSLQSFKMNLIVLSPQLVFVSLSLCFLVSSLNKNIIRSLKIFKNSRTSSNNRGDHHTHVDEKYFTVCKRNLSTNVLLRVNSCLLKFWLQGIVARLRRNFLHFTVSNISRLNTFHQTLMIILLLGHQSHKSEN